MKNQEKILSFGCLAIIILLIIAILSVILQKKDPPKNEAIEIREHLEVKELLTQLRIQHADIVYAQFILETGNATSSIYLSNNNLFGMKYPVKRPTTAVNKCTSGFAIYNCWTHSVYDYLIWQIINGWDLTRCEYLDLLSSRYATDDKYINKINSILE